MKPLALGLLALAALAAARPPLAQPGRHTFVGTITDSECASADHALMGMGPPDAECVVACISEHGARYVLYDGKNAYTLSDQRTPQKFAAQKVTVAGTLDLKTKTIQVESIAAAR